jgi:hypothetical protein
MNSLNKKDHEIHKSLKHIKFADVLILKVIYTENDSKVKMMK